MANILKEGEIISPVGNALESFEANAANFMRPDAWYNLQIRITWLTMATIDLVHKAYKLSLSPFLEGVLGVKCRFHPACSEYAVEAVKLHGWVKGLRLAAWRLLRCAPYCRGGLDPVPAKQENNPVKCSHNAVL